LKGAIDKYPVTMHLHKKDHTFSGYYFYTSEQEPIYFIGEDTTSKGKINLSAFVKSTEPADERFLFEFVDSKFTGEWRKSDSSKPFAFFAVESNDTKLIPFSFAYTYGEIKLKPEWEESPTATFEAASVWPSNNSLKSLLVKQIISKELSEKGAVEDLAKFFQKEKERFFEDYRESYKDTEDSLLRESTPMFTIDEMNEVLVVYQSATILSLANYSYAYTGGAHGNHGTRYISINMVNRKKLALNNVLTLTGQNKLSSLLEKYFRKDYGVDKNTSLIDAGLFESVIKPNNNFYVTGKGINFGYMPYEIGPYAMGEINIFIPFTELHNYLQPSFKNLVE